MKPTNIIKRTRPSELSKARGKRQEHSTRDFPKFIKQLDHIIDTFENLGYKLEAKKSNESKTK